MEATCSCSVAHSPLRQRNFISPKGRGPSSLLLSSRLGNTGGSPFSIPEERAWKRRVAAAGALSPPQDLAWRVLGRGSSVGQEAKAIAPRPVPALSHPRAGRAQVEGGRRGAESGGLDSGCGYVKRTPETHSRCSTEEGLLPSQRE